MRGAVQVVVGMATENLATMIMATHVAGQSHQQAATRHHSNTGSLLALLHYNSLAMFKPRSALGLH